MLQCQPGTKCAYTYFVCSHILNNVMLNLQKPTKEEIEFKNPGQVLWRGHRSKFWDPHGKQRIDNNCRPWTRLNQQSSVKPLVDTSVDLMSLHNKNWIVLTKLGNHHKVDGMNRKKSNLWISKANYILNILKKTDLNTVSLFIDGRVWYSAWFPEFTCLTVSMRTYSHVNTFWYNKQQAMWIYTYTVVNGYTINFLL